MRRRKLSKITLFITLIVGFFDVTVAVLGAGQARRFAVPRNSEPVPPSADPSVSLIRTQSFEFTGEVDSNSPVLRTIVDGEPTVVVFTSWGGTPSRASGPSLDDSLAGNTGLHFRRTRRRHLDRGGHCCR
jgi:hypothetical protein